MARRPPLQRLGRVVLGLVVMVAVVAVVGALLWRQAAAWGIPYSSYTNDLGSECQNTWTGVRCEPMTLADLDSRVGITFPAGTQIERAAYVETHNFAVTARLLIPRGEGVEMEKQLDEEFGPCQEVGRNPFPADAARNCLRTSDGVRQEDGGLPPNVWVVASAVPQDREQLVVDLDLRSR